MSIFMSKRADQHREVHMNEDDMTGSGFICSQGR